MSSLASPTKLLTFMLVLAIGIGSCVYLAQSYAYLFEPTPPDKVSISDYTGVVIQVDQPTHISGGLFFSSSRTDTYVTFDNNQTYWIPDYQVIVEGRQYHVHSVKTVSYGARAMGNGTLTRIENTFVMK